MCVEIMEIPRWVWMWCLAGALFALAKALLLQKEAALTGWHALAFAAAWPGMDVQAWRPSARRVEMPLPWYSGLAALTAGVLCTWGLAGCWSHPLASGWTGMIGLVLMLHFGLFRMLAGFWQRRGLPVRPLMDQPLLAVTVAEFWRRRWNRAFRDLSHALIARPVAQRWNGTAARWLVFLASGLAHELVISVPAGAGYGLPTAYFALQAAGMECEKRWHLRGHVWAFAVIALPAFFLFHPPFVERVMLPFLHFLNALP